MPDTTFGPDNLRAPYTLFEKMNNCHVTGKHRVAIIVYAQNNFNKPYTQTQRSYASHSDQWGWDYSKSGQCRIGDCLDGTDQGIRLDWYTWEIEGWYWQDEENE